MTKNTDFFGGEETARPAEHARMGRSFVTSGRATSAASHLLDAMDSYVRGIVREELSKSVTPKLAVAGSQTTMQPPELLSAIAALVGGAAAATAPAKRRYTMSERAVLARGARDEAGRFLPKEKSKKQQRGLKK